MGVPKRPRIRPATDWRASPLAVVLGPVETFVHQSTAGSLVLLAAAALALVLANSPAAGAYNALLHTEITLSFGPYALSYDLLHWINDGLMAIFFFLVGLELKREVLVGELSDRQAMALPVVAAIGGALLPALIYVLINRGGPGAAGWGVPMATDIAFALGILGLLGNRIPASVRVFVTAVAIADDLLAVLVIALFYSEQVNGAPLLIGLGVLALLGLLNLLGVRHLFIYGLLGFVVVWVAFMQSGVHATVAGVLVALTVPARRKIDGPTFHARSTDLISRFRSDADDGRQMLTDQQQQDVVLALEDTCESVQAPLQKAEHRLHGWVAFGILPLFALANAGVSLSPSALTSALGNGGVAVTLGIAAGLLIGKPVGLLGAIWLALRAGWATLPVNVTWRHMIGVGCLAGVGFTMSLFIASLAFGEGDLLSAAKLGILGASAIAGVTGYLVLRALPAPAGN